MKPEHNVPLCPFCTRYLGFFLTVTQRKGRKLCRCKSCGKIGLHRVYDLEAED